ncbi:MAG: response regulator [Acidobacteriota bacterium]
MSGKILVVEDEVDIQLTLQAILEGAGHQVLVASNGAEGLEKLQEHEPDLVISDVNMDVMDGWEFVERLRVHPRLRFTPVIFMTSLAAHEDRLRGLRLGADDYLNKPPNVEELETRVEAALQRSQAMRSTLGPPEEETAAPADFQGDLSQLSPGAILAMFEFESKTGLLELKLSGEVGRIWLRDGRVVDAELGGDSGATGLDAVYAIVLWKAGRFSFRKEDVDREDVINNPTTHLLMEAARLADEGGREG